MLGRFEAGRQMRFPVPEDRVAYLHVVRGTLELESHALAAGDGATIHAAASYPLGVVDDSEVLLFDLTD